MADWDHAQARRRPGDLRHRGLRRMADRRLARRLPVPVRAVDAAPRSERRWPSSPVTTPRRPMTTPTGWTSWASWGASTKQSADRSGRVAYPRHRHRRRCHARLLLRAGGWRRWQGLLQGDAPWLGHHPEPVAEISTASSASGRTGPEDPPVCRCRHHDPGRRTPQPARGPATPQRLPCARRSLGRWPRAGVDHPADRGPQRAPGVGINPSASADLAHLAPAQARWKVCSRTAPTAGTSARSVRPSRCSRAVMKSGGVSGS